MLRLICICFLFVVSSNAFGVMVGLCPATPPFGMIPCDAACTGASAVLMASTVNSAELSLANEFNNLNNEWVDAGNSDTDLISAYIVSKQNNSQYRIQTYSAVEATISSNLSINAQQESVGLDNILVAAEAISNSKKAASLQTYNLNNQSSGIESTKIPEMLSKAALLSDPINNKDLNSEILANWSEDISDYTDDELGELILTTDASILAALALNDGKLSLVDSSEITKLLTFLYLNKEGGDSISSKTKYIKHMLSIDLLIKSFDIDPVISENLTQTEIAKDWFTSKESIANLSLMKPRDIAIDLNVASGIENALLNDYLSIKKRKNLVRALN